MCLQTSSVRCSQKWHWAGDAIVPDPSIPASRRIPGSGKTQYEIDVRSFLSIEGNAVVRHHLEALARGLSEPDRVFFQSRLTGSFDSRAIHVANYIGRNLEYFKKRRTFDNWLFPEETLAVGGGDCEDLAFVLAVLLEASGVSPYNIRVAFGSVVDCSRSLERARFDHAWVMYKAKSGAWQILEPLAILGRHLKRQAPSSMRRLQQKRTVPDLDYVPHFVFNRTHLWKVNSDEDDAASNIQDYMAERRSFWKGFEPSFAASVHAQIFDDALSDMSAIDLDRVKLSSLMIDIDTLHYDPRDHFDFAYISEGWQRVPERLATGDLTDFARAVHAVGDFYAHTLYADFAPCATPSSPLPLYDPASPLPASKIAYDFSPYAPLPGCNASVGAAAAMWKGKLISGQWWRWYSTFPSDLKERQDFPTRRCLPDHDMVAVDGPTRGSGHRRYNASEYSVQFRLRYNAAVRHVRKIYADWKAS